MKIELEDHEIATIRVALVTQIELYEEILSKGTNHKDKNYWSLKLDESKSAFLKIYGKTIEEYRERIDKIK